MRALKNIKNSFDYFLRNALPWGRTLDPASPVDVSDEKFQTEVEEFLKLFSWRRPLDFIKAETPGVSRLKITDVGTRNFSAAPVFERVFSECGFEAEIHGFEIDAFRRLTNLRTRADYGNYYARQIRSGFFHTQDFLTWHDPQDLIFLLHPFVTPEPHLAWGLPMRKFKPRELFEHSRKLLNPSKGLLLVSCPSADELDISHKLATRAGFTLVERRNWIPKGETSHQKPRLGCLYQ